MFTQSTPSAPSASLFNSSSSSSSPPSTRSPGLLLPISNTRLRGGLQSLARHLANSTSREQRTTHITPQVVNTSSPLLAAPAATSPNLHNHQQRVDNPPTPPQPPAGQRELVTNNNTSIAFPCTTSAGDSHSSSDSADNHIHHHHHRTLSGSRSLERRTPAAASTGLTRSGFADTAATANNIIPNPAPTNVSTGSEPEPDPSPAAPTVSPAALATAATASSSFSEENNYHFPPTFSSSTSPPSATAVSPPPFPSVRRRSLRESLQASSNIPSDSAVPAAFARIRSRSLLLRLRQHHSEASPASVTATNIQTTTASPGHNISTSPTFGDNSSSPPHHPLPASIITVTTNRPTLSLPLPFSDSPTTPPSGINSTASSSRGVTSSSDGPSLPLVARATNRPSYIPRTAVNDPNYGHAAMTRTRSATSAEVEAAPIDAPSAPSLPSIRFSTYLDPRSHRPSLTFSPISRTLPTGGEVIRVGRYSERDGHAPVPNGTPSAAPVGFKSKVVSRRHCEFWYENNRWYIKDVKSSSGTFLNHIRLSPPGTESKPFPVNDGDIVQLGIDFKGGEEMIFRCVKMRLELNRNWQTKLNAFNMSAHNKLKALAMSGASSSYTQDCSICLNSIAPCQSLFVAPCSHTWHYKCVRTLLSSSQYPIFVCPNCRATTDLEMDPEEPDNSHLEEWQKFNDAAEVNGDSQSQLSVQPPQQVLAPAQPNSEQPQRERVAPLEDNTALAGSAGAIDAETTVLAVDTSSAGPSASSPVPIPVNNAVSSDSTRGHGRTQTPNGVPAISNGHEGPITPRNDAGPWVFDGSAGRPGASSAPNGVASLDSAMDID